jgi:phage protein D
MAITPVYCGKLSAAQRQQFGTTAAGGLIYRYANHSGTLSGAAKLFAGFTNGATTAGENYAGSLPDIAPGQSAEGEVDAIGISGQNLAFTGCEVLSYALVTTDSGVDPVSYAG